MQISLTSIRTISTKFWQYVLSLCFSYSTKCQVKIKFFLCLNTGKFSLDINVCWCVKTTWKLAVFTLFDKMVTSNDRWPQMTVDHNGQQVTSSTLQGLTTDISTYSNFHFFTYFANNVSDFHMYWPQMTFDLREVYLPRATYIPSLKFKQLLLLEISWLQNIQTLTSGDLKWPWSSMKNNRDHLFTKGYQHTKC